MTTAPTPAEAFGGRRVVDVDGEAVDVRGRLDGRPLLTTNQQTPFFAWRAPGVRASSVAVRRAQTLSAAADAADRLAKALAALRGNERDLDLNLERYRRAAARADDALDAFDDALADPAGPPPPLPTARDL